MAQQNKEQKNRRYRLLLNDDESHQNLWIIKFTRTRAVLATVTVSVILCALIYSIIAFTPVRTFIPGYPDAQTRRTALQNAMKIDSLENMAGKWSLYAENLRRVLDGEETIKIDSLLQLDADSVSHLDPLAISKQDSILRKTVQEEEQFNVSDKKSRVLPLEGRLFFTPVKGVISQGYDPNMHPYLDITAAEGSPVKATLDGTVIFTGWDEDTGNTIQIQHSGDIVSIYKHNQKLLKKTGDKVTAGTPIAIIGSTGDLSDGPYLHFELWHRGETADPTKYINF